jgi:hypothetical protein
MTDSEATNNINNVNNEQHVHINVFGKEDLDYLLKDGNLLQRLKNYSKKGIYGLADVIKEIHCNKEQPHNNTIIKPVEYGDGVFIMGDESEWEFREFEDIRETLMNTISKYVHKYNEVKTKSDVKLTDVREKCFIKHLTYSLLALNGEIPNDLYDELEIDDNKVEENTDKIKSILRKFDKSTMNKLHEYTIPNYKKENGTYVNTT